MFLVGEFQYLLWRWRYKKKKKKKGIADRKVLMSVLREGHRHRRVCLE